jgi:hypothetical protein
MACNYRFWVGSFRRPLCARRFMVRNAEELLLDTRHMLNRSLVPAAGQSIREKLVLPFTNFVIRPIASEPRQSRPSAFMSCVC